MSLNNKTIGKAIIIGSIASNFLGVGLINVVTLIIGNVILNKNSSKEEKQKWLLISLIGYIASYLLFAVVLYLVFVFA
ncbi:MAG: hypothetical protein Wins2KO_03230 [Winogradskyella sp.]